MKKKSILDLLDLKKKNVKATWVTAYDAPVASFAEQGGMDMLLVGDSMGMVILGYQSTIPVTMEDCIIHCKAVRRGAPNTFCIGDMPFGSYQVSVPDAVANAVRFLKEADMDAIKLEGGRCVTPQIKAISEAGIVVFGHIGLTPQSSGQLGGFKAQGRTVTSARELIKDAIAIEEAGARAILIEAVPPEVTRFIWKRLSIPIYSIGAGIDCDGQLTICGDMLGLFQAFSPKFVKKYANVAEIMIGAFREYAKDIRELKFPGDEHVYHISEDIKEFEDMFKEFN